MSGANSGSVAFSTHQLLVSQLRAGRTVCDDAFDMVYPAAQRRVSRRFWTPVEVAKRAAAMLASNDGPPARVIDVGAGVGKFCAVGALTTHCTFIGIEHRVHLVELALRTLHVLRIRSVEMIHGGLEEVRWSEFDAYYLFNPFEENLYPASEQLDGTVSLSRTRFCRDVALVEAALDRARVGTRVVTYHGFGGRIPSAFRLVRSERCGTNFLRLWLKTREGSTLRTGRLEALMP